MEAIEKVDTNAIQLEAEEAIAKGSTEALGALIDRLERRHREYLAQAQQEASAAQQAQKELANVRTQLAHADPTEAKQRYVDQYFASDLHNDRAKACQRQAEEVGKILPELRGELERILARRKAGELAAEAGKIKADLAKTKAKLLPPLKEVVERAAALGREAREFNQMAQGAKIPQEQFLRCDLELSRLLSALEGLDVHLAPELESLVSPSPDGAKKVVLRVPWQGHIAGRGLVLPAEQAEDLVNAGFARAV